MSRLRALPAPSAASVSLSAPSHLRVADVVSCPHRLSRVHKPRSGCRLDRAACGSRSSPPFDRQCMHASCDDTVSALSAHVPVSVSESVSEPAFGPTVAATAKASRVIELCAGSASFTRYHLDANPDARAIVVDRLSVAKMRALIPVSYHPRIVFVSQDVGQMSLGRLERIVARAWHVPLAAVDAIHCSPDCTCLSKAHHGQIRHYHGATPLTSSARRDLRDLTHMLALLASVSRLATGITISVENPVGKFLICLLCSPSPACLAGTWFRVPITA